MTLHTRYAKTATEIDQPAMATAAIAATSGCSASLSRWPISSSIAEDPERLGWRLNGLCAQTPANAPERDADVHERRDEGDRGAHTLKHRVTSPAVTASSP